MDEVESRAAEEMLVLSERGKNLKHVVSEVMIRKGEFSSGDIDGSLG